MGMASREKLRTARTLSFGVDGTGLWCSSGAAAAAASSLASDVPRSSRLRLLDVAGKADRRVGAWPLETGVTSTVSVISIGVDGSGLTLRPVSDSLSTDA